MEIVSFKNLTFAYPGSSGYALRNIDLSVEKGEFVLLCGVSGSGKSTLLRHLKSALAPKGERKGKVLFCGNELDEISEREQARDIGFVGQDPEAMIVTDKVWHELAFGLENLGEDSASIRRRSAEMAEFFGISELYMRPVSELSGGQKQLLALAASVTVRPSLLILDEPSAQLDPIAAHEFFSAVARLNRELGITVIVSEHRTEEVFPYADRLICLEDGEVILNVEPCSVSAGSFPEKIKQIVPVSAQIWFACGGEGECPYSVADGRKWLSSKVTDRPSVEHSKFITEGDPLVSAKGVSFRYNKTSSDVLSELDFNIGKGELVGVLGGNGSGKSTFLSVLMGLRKPHSGKVISSSKMLMMPQKPLSLFVRDTLYDDLLEMCSDIPADEKNVRIDEVAELCCLDGLLERHPYDLSGGEIQRAALAKLLLGDPEVLLLDEPTKGTDPIFKRRFASILKSICTSGKAVVIVSHDIEFCAENCTRCTMLFGGELLGDAPAFEFFGNNCFYTTAASRMSSGLIDGAVTAEDVIKTLGGELPKNTDPPRLIEPPSRTDAAKRSAPHKRSFFGKMFLVVSALFSAFSVLSCAGVFGDMYPENSLLPYILLGVSLTVLTFALSVPNRSSHSVKHKRSYSKRAVLGSVLILTLIPLTVYFGATYLNTGKYLFVSLVVMLEATLPFYLLFESRSPRARELVVIAVLTASAVAGRVAFYMLPQFKPVLAVVVISGAAFGAHTGFLVGSLSMLLSNFLFGQGPWTPWQMFSMGLVGFLAGIVFERGILQKKRENVAVFGFVSAVVIYGGIVNPSTLFIMHNEINRASLIAVYTAGLPLDMIHGAASLIFLYFLTPSVFKKLDRLCTKYDFFE